MIGIVGLGFMGMTHFTAAKASRRVKVAAFATRNAKKRAGDWSSIQGNFGPRGEKETDLLGATPYEDWRDLIADDAVRLVDVCTPTPQHEEIALAALAAGKDVLVEKPIAPTLKAADRMIRAAEKSEGRLMVAHVLPFFAEWRFALDTVRGGRYGRLLAGHLRRHIAPPAWSNDMASLEAVGGWGVDLHIHDNHFINLLCGPPTHVVATGLLEAPGDDAAAGAPRLVRHTETQYRFEGVHAPALTASSGGIGCKSYEFVSGYELFLEKATLSFSAGTYDGQWVVDRPVTLAPARGPMRQPTLKGGTEWYSPFQNELEAAYECTRGGPMRPELDPHMAREALAVCFAEAKSIANGKIVKLPTAKS